MEYYNDIPYAVFRRRKRPHINGYILCPIKPNSNGELLVHNIVKRCGARCGVAGITYALDSVPRLKRCAGYVYEQEPDNIHSEDCLFTDGTVLFTDLKAVKGLWSVRPKWVAFKEPS